MSALLFLSGLFTVFAPLPLLLLYFRAGMAWTLLAVLTNLGVVQISTGAVSSGLYLVFVGALAVFLPLFLFKGRLGVEKSAALTLVGMALTGLALVSGAALVLRVDPLGVLREQVRLVVEYLRLASPNQGAGWDVPPEELQQSILREFPSAVAVFALAILWANVTLLLRLSPLFLHARLGLSREYLRAWKAPEWLVWPTIASGAAVLFVPGLWGVVGLNAFKFLMAIYAIQGLSVLSYFLDFWRVGGLLRSFAYLSVVFLMMPLLLAVGFFDLWFDFRKRFRQTQ